MGQQGIPDATRQKPCPCQVRAVARVTLIPTGGVNAQVQRQFKCRICGDGVEVRLPARLMHS
jgi:hypothetical protein